MKTIRIILAIVLLASTLQQNRSFAQASAPRRQIIVDVAHGQRFYNDPATNKPNGIASAERIKYMTGELTKNATSLNAQVSYQATSITPKELADCDLLFIHIPAAKYSPAEITAIRQYLQKGGSLFLVMDEDHWTTLARTNVNDIVSPYGIVYKDNSPDQTSGGYSAAGPVTGKQFSIPYHGARIVEGGDPFCFSKQTREHPFGVYKTVKNGGKIIAMGDGMVSLYMTEWEGVKDYQCSQFMQDAFAWLLK